MNVRAHLLKANRNKTFLSNHLMKLLKYCPDWVSIVAFYTALHFIEALLKKKHNLDFAHHEERHSFISANIPEIFSAYYRLYDLGFNSRYMSVNDAPSCEEADSAVRYELAEVEEFIMSRI